MHGEVGGEDVGVWWG